MCVDLSLSLYIYIYIHMYTYYTLHMNLRHTRSCRRSFFGAAASRIGTAGWNSLPWAT